MTADELTCAQVDEQDLDLRYLTGKLSEPEAEAFETHYSSCDRCWALVEQGASVRATRLPAGVAAPTAAGGARPHRRWWLMALAASLAIVALGLWQRGPRSPLDQLRGDADSLALHLESATGALRVSWPPVSDASRYLVRLHQPDGGLLLQEELGDTTFAVLRDSLHLDAGATRLFWLVEAMSRTGAVLARSGLVPQPLLPPEP